MEPAEALKQVLVAESAGEFRPAGCRDVARRHSLAPCLQPFIAKPLKFGATEREAREPIGVGQFAEMQLKAANAGNRWIIIDDVLVQVTETLVKLDDLFGNAPIPAAYNQPAHRHAGSSQTVSGGPSGLAHRGTRQSTSR